jgi:transcription elongation factor/antiterminator RfaH
MGNEKAGGAQHWYAIYTHPKQESRAEYNLRAWNVETFNPKLKERQQHTFTGAPTFVVKQLFPRYIFARFDAEALLHKVWFTRGVHSVVSFGDEPAAIEDEVIDFIRSKNGADGFINLSEELRAGSKVVIKDGPLRNLAGIFELEVKDSTRVIILLEAISYQGRVVVEREQVRKVR